MTIKESVEELKDYLDCSSNFGTRYFTEAVENVVNELETSKNENIKKDKVIEEMAKALNTYDIDDDICGKFGKNKDCNDFTNENLCVDCIKEYFYKKAEEEKMSISVDLEKVNYEKFINNLMVRFEKINNRDLLEKVILEFGNHIGEDLILLHNEYYEDGICTWNMCNMIEEIFDFAEEEEGEAYSVYFELRKKLIGYKEIDEAYENLGIKRK